VTSDLETAASTRRGPTNGLDAAAQLLIGVILAVILIDALALVLFPPQNADPAQPYAFPADAIRGNLSRSLRTS